MPTQQINEKWLPTFETVHSLLLKEKNAGIRTDQGPTPARDVADTVANIRRYLR